MEDHYKKEIQKHQPQSNVAVVEGRGLVPTDFNGLWRMSNIIAKSGFAPKDMQRPESVFVAAQMGLEVGLSVMAAIQNIAVINGRPAIWGDSVLALVRASGKLASFEESFTGTWPNGDFTAVCKAKRAGEKKENVRRFSIDDAKIAGLWQYPAKGVTPWHKYPKRMLQMRARSWALRDTFGDVLKGLKMAEEVMDYDVDLVQTQSGEYEAPKAEKAEPKFDESVFWDCVKVHDQGMISKFLFETAEAQDVTEYDVKQAAAKDPETFIAAFKAWLKSNSPVQEEKTESEPLPNELLKKKPGTLTSGDWEIIANGKGGYSNLKTSGLSTFVFANLDHIKAAPQEHFDAIKAKWERIIEDNPFPIVVPTQSGIEEEKNDEYHDPYDGKPDQARLRDDIWQRCCDHGSDIVAQAQENIGQIVGQMPPLIGHAEELLKECERIAEEQDKM